MNEFTASNGIEVAFDADSLDNIYLAGRKQGNLHASAGEEGIVALREFFQAERDEALGRWRSRSNPSWVVYPDASNPSRGRMVNEDGGEWNSAHPDSHWSSRPDLNEVNQEFLAAHPEPKPWWDAAEGEAWELTVNGDTGPFVTKLTPALTVHFVAGNGSQFMPESDQITAGRRIYPEVAA